MARRYHSRLAEYGQRQAAGRKTPPIESFIKGISIHRFKSCICYQMQGSALLM